MTDTHGDASHVRPNGRHGLLVAGLGWLVMVIGLFAATWIGHQAEKFGTPPAAAAVLRGLVVTAAVAALAWRLRQRSPIARGLLPLSRQSALHLLLGMLLPVVLAACGFALARLFGWIEITAWHLSWPLAAAMLANAGVALLYEALPEEWTMRGLVYGGLRVKLPAVLAWLGQIGLFALVPVAANALQRLAGMAPGAEINADYVILLLAFGTALQLLRACTGNLWASVGFHLAYLEIARFAIAQPDVRLLTYVELEEGTGSLFVLFAMVVLGGILVAGAAAVWQRVRKKRAK